MERDMNYDLELARYIWSILKSDLPVLMSWGVEIETVKVIKCGIEFKVNGFKHTGKVQIVLNEMCIRDSCEGVDFIGTRNLMESLFYKTLKLKGY